MAVATLLTVGNSEWSQRCDARCHDATPGTPCDCVCGGRYHSLGGDQAVELCREDVASGRYGAELAGIAQHLTEVATQGDLFTGGGGA